MIFLLSLLTMLVVGTLLFLTVNSYSHALVIRILKILQTGEKLYGIQLREKLGVGGSIYVTLHHMERMGWISSIKKNENLEQRGGRPRRYYSITESGLHELIRADIKPE